MTIIIIMHLFRRHHVHFIILLRCVETSEKKEMIRPLLLSCCFTGKSFYGSALKYNLFRDSQKFATAVLVLDGLLFTGVHGEH